MKSNAERNDAPTRFLTGKILVAMPNMGDPRFHRAVILVCAHDGNGAMGLVLNHPLPGVDLRQLLAQLHIEAEAPLSDVPVMSGGPVENARGFILHTPEFKQQDTITITPAMAVTGTVDALRAVAGGTGPRQMVFILGYAGWGEGQLDQEIQDNVWLVGDVTPDLVFATGSDEKWERAIRQMGVDPVMLSGAAGRA